MWRDSRSEGRRFEFVVNFLLFVCLKKVKINKKRAGIGPFKKLINLSKRSSWRWKLKHQNSAISLIICCPPFEYWHLKLFWLDGLSLCSAAASFYKLQSWDKVSTCGMALKEINKGLIWQKMLTWTAATLFNISLKCTIQKKK